MADAIRPLQLDEALDIPLADVKKKDFDLVFSYSPATSADYAVASGILFRSQQSEITA